MSVDNNYRSLLKAAKIGNTDEVRRLIPLSHRTPSKRWVLFHAARNGHSECVELLIPVSDPKDNKSYALREAASNGHDRCVELLIPVSDAQADDSATLRYAVANGHEQCIELLYPVSDPIVALSKLKEEFAFKSEHWIVLERMIEAERLNTVLHRHIGEQVERTTETKIQRKM